MRDKYDVYTDESLVPIASDLTVSDAEYIDFNMRVLGADTESVRRNPAADLRAIDARISQILGAVPKTFKSARAVASELANLDRRAKSEIVQKLKGLYEERDVAKFPAFANAVASTLKRELSRNQEFFASRNLISKLIECQASAFRDSVELEDQATFDNLSEAEQALVVDLLVFLEAFVSVEEGAGAFATTSAFFTSLGALTPKQLRTVLNATSGLEFEEATGSHYAPYVMMYIQTLFAIDTRATIAAFESKPEDSKYSSICKFIDSIRWPEQLGARGASCDSIANEMQGTGVDTYVLNLSIAIVIGSNKTPGLSGSEDLMKALRAANAVAPDVQSLAPLSEVFVFAKAINTSITDPSTRKSLLGSAYSKTKKSPAEGFKILRNKLKAPPSIEPSYIWQNYVHPPRDRDLHYLEWGFSLYGAMSEAGMGIYDDTIRGERDSDICKHFGSDAGRADLDALIEFCDLLRAKGITSKDIYKNRDLMDVKSAGLIPQPLPSDVIRESSEDGRKAFTRIVDESSALSLQTLCTNLLCAALDIEDPYDLSRYQYEVVNHEANGIEFSIAISTPYNPLELVSGYRTLGSCCMRPYNAGTKASMTSFYGGLSGTPSPTPSRTAYVFAHDVVRSGKSDPEIVCAGTMYLPIFEVDYDAKPTSPSTSAELVYGSAGIAIRTEGVIPAFPRKARSFDGFEYTDKARGIPDAILTTANQVLVNGILQSSVAAQMGLLGSLGQAGIDSPSPEGLEITAEAEYKGPDDFRGTYVDYWSPKATGILGGVFDVRNADSLFTDVTFELASPESLEFTVTYAIGGRSAPRFKAAWVEMQYMWSLPKFEAFIPLKGGVVFEIPGDVNAGILDRIEELVIPAWFDGCNAKPLIRTGRKLRKADLIEMRTPRKGIAIATSSETAYIVDPN